MKIMIIRHGDPDYSIDSLTEKGFREAALLAKMLKDKGIDDFYTSPLGRARATAAPTLAEYGKDAEVLDWLEEFRGKMTSKTTGNPRIVWDLPPSSWCNEDALYNKDNCYLAEYFGENSADGVFRDMARGMDALLERYGWVRSGMEYRGGEDKTIALFCHHGLGSALLAYLIGISPVVAQNNLFLSPTSVTTLVSETDSRGVSHFRAIAIGDTSHLYVGGEPMSESGLHPNFDK